MLRARPRAATSRSKTTAHLNSMMLFFILCLRSLSTVQMPQVDGVKNPKVQSVFFDDMPVHHAAFADGGAQVGFCSALRGLHPVRLSEVTFGIPTSDIRPPLFYITSVASTLPWLRHIRCWLQTCRLSCRSCCTTLLSLDKSSRLPAAKKLSTSAIRPNSGGNDEGIERHPNAVFGASVCLLRGVCTLILELT